MVYCHCTISRSKNLLILRNPATIKAYFEKVRQLAKQGEQYPVDLDDVWPLVYSLKQKAVKQLEDGYFEKEDFIIFTQTGENSASGRGRPKKAYKVSVSCMEHLIARKVRAVFEVYRQVFCNRMARGVIGKSPNKTTDRQGFTLKGVRSFSTNTPRCNGKM